MPRWWILWGGVGHCYLQNQRPTTPPQKGMHQPEVKISWTTVRSSTTASETPSKDCSFQVISCTVPGCSDKNRRESTKYPQNRCEKKKRREDKRHSAVPIFSQFKTNLWFHSREPQVKKNCRKLKCSRRYAVERLSGRWFPASALSLDDYNMNQS